MVNEEPNESDAETFDRFPCLDSATIAKIEAGLREIWRSNAPSIDSDRWKELEPKLAQYKQEAEYVRNFINKGQVRLLNSVAQRSDKLLAALEKAEDHGLLLILEHSVDPQRLEDVSVALRSMADGPVAV